MTRAITQPGFSQGFARLPGRRRPHPILTELRGYWDARLGNTGATLYDFSGFQNPMVLAGGARWVTGHHGHSLGFVRATGDHAQAGSLAHLEIRSHWTLAARLRITAAPAFDQGILTCQVAAGGGLWGLWVDNARKLVASQDETLVGYIDATSVSALTTGQMYSVAGLWDGANLRVFIDGRHEANVGVTGIPQGLFRDICLACGHAAGANCLSCEIDYAAVWARDLTWAELTDLHEDSLLLARAAH